jgi:hypothetical protein
VRTASGTASASATQIEFEIEATRSLVSAFGIEYEDKSGFSSSAFSWAN